MKRDDWQCLGAILVVLLILGGAIGFHWYRAGLQTRVYQREGIELSQWEVFWGAKPAERTINLK